MFEEHILVKWDDWKQKGRFPSDISLQRSIEEGREVWLKPDAREGMAWLFKLKDKSLMWVRQAKLSSTFSLIVIGYGPDVVEICSWRSMRQMGKAWIKMWRSVHPAQRQEADRLEQIFKFKFIREVKGGLMNQEKSRVSQVCRAHEKSRLAKKDSEYLEPNLDLFDIRL